MLCNIVLVIRVVNYIYFFFSNRFVHLQLIGSVHKQTVERPEGELFEELLKGFKLFKCSQNNLAEIGIRKTRVFYSSTRATTTRRYQAI